MIYEGIKDKDSWECRQKHELYSWPSLVTLRPNPFQIVGTRSGIRTRHMIGVGNPF